MKPNRLPRSLDEYKNGQCHIFALALNKATGWPIKALWDLEPMDDDCRILPTALVHMWCVPPSPVETDDDILDAVDSEGPFNGESSEADYPCNTPDYAGHTPKNVVALIRKKVLEAPLPGEVDALVDYIRKNPEKYTGFLALEAGANQAPGVRGR